MKYKAVILKKYGKAYRKEKVVKYKPEKLVISYEKKTFPITPDIHCYVDKNTTYVFIDWENEKIIKFNEYGIGVDASFLDTLLTTSKVGIVGQLFNAINLDFKNEKSWVQYINPIVIFIVGAITGYFFGT